MTKIAAIQMCSSDNVRDNLMRAGNLVQQAAQCGASLAVLPEMFPFMGNTPEAKLAVQEAAGAGPIQDFLAMTAARHQIYLVGGSIPLRSSAAHKISAACLTYNPEGKLINRYNKMHLFDVDVGNNEIYQESATTEAGNQLEVVNTSIGKLGVAICYDIRFPEQFRYLAQQGAEIFVLPAAFTVPTGRAHWHVLCRSRAIENLCYLVAAAQWGTHANQRQTFGHSLIVNPWGEIIAEATEAKDCVLIADIDLVQLQAWRKKLPVLQHQKFTITM